MNIFTVTLILVLNLIAASLLFKDSGALENYEINNPDSRFLLDNSVREVSGLTFTDDNRLFAHNDERGIIFNLDPVTGSIIKRFYVGKLMTAEADFEGIAFAGGSFYLTTSSGVVYVFKEGGNNESVQFKKIYSGLSEKFNVEGICYDKKKNSLLLACKEYPGKGINNARVVYELPINSGKLNPAPRFIIGLSELKKKFGIKDFYPSDIAVNPLEGTFFILSARQGGAIIELTGKGELVNGKKLSGKIHPQPEGIAFKKDGTMLIGDEGVKGKASIAVYKYKD